MCNKFNLIFFLKKSHLKFWNSNFFFLACLTCVVRPNKEKTGGLTITKSMLYSMRKLPTLRRRTTVIQSNLASWLICYTHKHALGVGF